MKDWRETKASEPSEGNAEINDAKNDRSLEVASALLHSISASGASRQVVAAASSALFRMVMQYDKVDPPSKAIAAEHSSGYCEVADKALSLQMQLAKLRKRPYKSLRDALVDCRACWSAGLKKKLIDLNASASFARHVSSVELDSMIGEALDAVRKSDCAAQERPEQTDSDSTGHDLNISGITSSGESGDESCDKKMLSADGQEIVDAQYSIGCESCGKLLCADAHDEFCSMAMDGANTSSAPVAACSMAFDTAMKGANPTCSLAFKMVYDKDGELIDVFPSALPAGSGSHRLVVSHLEESPAQDLREVFYEVVGQPGEHESVCSDIFKGINDFYDLEGSSKFNGFISDCGTFLRVLLEDMAESEFSE